MNIAERLAFIAFLAEYENTAETAQLTYLSEKEARAVPEDVIRNINLQYRDAGVIITRLSSGGIVIDMGADPDGIMVRTGYGQLCEEVIANLFPPVQETSATFPRMGSKPKLTIVS